MSGKGSIRGWVSEIDAACIFVFGTHVPPIGIDLQGLVLPRARNSLFDCKLNLTWQFHSQRKRFPLHLDVVIGIRRGQFSFALDFMGQ